MHGAPSARSRPTAWRRRGFTLLEITLAAGVLAVLATTSLQMLRVLGAQQRLAERRALAIQTAQALAEQIGNLPWDELTAPALARLEIPPAAARQLPGAKLAVRVDEEMGAVAARRVAIELSWNGGPGSAGRPVRLTTWVFPE